MNDTPKAANAMWGGRFASGPDAIMEAINASISFDQRLALQDIEGSRAHAAMLASAGIITDKDASAIREGLLTVLSEIQGGKFTFSPAPAAAMIRWHWISACGSATNAIRPKPR